jgi:hypothetical protein
MKRQVENQSLEFDHATCRWPAGANLGKCGFKANTLRATGLDAAYVATNCGDFKAVTGDRA